MLQGLPYHEASSGFVGGLMDLEPPEGADMEAFTGILGTD